MSEILQENYTLRGILRLNFENISEKYIGLPRHFENIFEKYIHAPRH